MRDITAFAYFYHKGLAFQFHGINPAEPEAAGAALETGLFSTALSLPVGAGSKAAGLLRFSKISTQFAGREPRLKHHPQRCRPISPLSI